MAGTIPQEIQRINGEVATQAAKIAQLSTILDGKAGGGGGGGSVVEWVSTNSLTVTSVNNDSMIPGTDRGTTYYYEVPSECTAVLVHSNSGTTYTAVVNRQSDGSFSSKSYTYQFAVSDADGTGTGLSIFVNEEAIGLVYILPLSIDFPD